MDRTLFRIVLLVLGVAVLLGMSGLLLLAYAEKNVPAEFVAMTFAALTAITGLLARHPSSEHDAATPVTITNTASDPVPTSDVPAAAAARGEFGTGTLGTIGAVLALIGAGLLLLDLLGVLATSAVVAVVLLLTGGALVLTDRLDRTP